MPIDASIPLQVRQVQLQDPTEVMGRVMNLRTLAGQQQLQQIHLEQQQRAQEQERTLADLYRGNVGDDGTVNRQAILGAAAQRGLGARIPTLQKQFAEADEAQAKLGKLKSETGEIDFNVSKKRMDVSAAAINSLVSNPNVTHQDVITTMVNLVNQGIVTPEQGQQAIRELPGRPEQLRPFLMQKGLQVMDAAKRMEMLTPKFEKIDNGGAVQLGTIDQLTGQFTPNQAVRKVATPDAVLSSQTTMRGQNMTDRRERSLAAQGVTYQQDADGNLVALPTKGVPGQAVRGAPVTGPDGSLLAGKSNMTEDQSKASGWLNQANNAWSNMQAVMERNPGAANPGFGDAVNKIPLVGGVGNFVKSAHRQQFSQAASSLSEALLRAATGAGVNKDEAAQKIQELTPQFGDSDAVIKQKMDSIPMYIESLKTRAGPGAKKMAAINGAAKPGAIDFQLPPDIQAILNKHGAK